MLEVIARVTLVGARHGGLDKPVRNGLRPSFDYAGELVACELWAEGVDELVPLDQPFRARVRLPYGDRLGWSFAGGEPFALNIASQVIGEGVVLSVV